MSEIEALEAEREVLIAYLFAKAYSHDWHAVSDAANDLRVIDVHLDHAAQSPHEQ